MHDRRHASEPLRLGPFQLDLRARELRKDGQRIRLQDKPFELIATLTERPGELFTRDELRRRLWPADTFLVFDDSLNTAVNKAREALGDSAESPQFIETVPRHGYRFIGPVAGNGDVASEPIAPAARPEEAAQPIATPVVHAEAPRRRLRVSVTAAITSAAIVVAVASAFALRWRNIPAPALVRFQVHAPPSTQFPRWPTGVALSPDGQQIAFGAVSNSEQVERIWLHSLNSSAVQRLTGTDGASHPCWAPDGRSIAFTALGKLMRYDLQKESAQQLAQAEALGLSWSAEGGILFARGQGHGLYRIFPGGGAPDALTTLDATREETIHAWPQWLPDGRSFIYLALSRRPQQSGVYVARIGGSARRLVLAGGYRAIYAEPGVLVYRKDSRLVGQRFHPPDGTLQGAPVDVASDVYSHEADGGVALASSRSGALAYSSRVRLPSRELVWVDRAGRRLATPGAADHYAGFSLSPDGRFVALQRMMPEIEPPAPDLWTLDLARSVRSRLTNQPGNDEGGVWAPDSRRFAYARHRGLRQPADVYLKDMREPEKDQPLLVDDAGSKHPFDWSPDGGLLLYGLAQPNSPRQDIWVLPLAGDRAPFPWLATTFNEAEARFSPDGRWVAHESDETGRPEIFIRSFASPGVRVQISSGGGTKPQWRRDGKELYYVSADYQLMAVPLRAGQGLEPGASRALFELRRLQPAPSWPTPYAVSADGRRFLVGAVVDEGGSSPITVVLNWTQLFDR
jgi:eukaryotic-like serine/threonine-protein kinase